MMLRRRAMLGLEQKQLYAMSIINQLDVVFAFNEDGYEVWHYSGSFTYDAATGTFLLNDPREVFISTLNYATTVPALLGHYGIAAADSDAYVYFFPADCTFEYIYDPPFYLVSVYGNIQEYLPA